MVPDYAAIGTKIGELVATKQAQYGDAITFVRQVIELLYPDGVPVSAYGDLLLLVRMLDKIKRISTRHQQDTENPYEDLAGYGILGVAKHEQTSTGRIYPQNDVIGRTYGATR